jgi:hypothetical protein
MPQPNFLTWDGWHTFLHHKVPSGTFAHLLAATQALSIERPHSLTRGDLPLYPRPEAAAREQRFQTDIRALASTAMKARTAQVNAMASVLKQGAQNIQMASMPAGSYYYN